jgi:hypothetical protein
MIFSKNPTPMPKGETILSSLALNLKSQQSREDCVRKDLTDRLKGVCVDLPLPDFEALISKMTREQLRGEGAVHGRTRLS